MKKTILFVGGMESNIGSTIEDLKFGIENNQDRYIILSREYNKGIFYKIKRSKDNKEFHIEIKEVIWKDILIGNEGVSFFKKTLLLLYWLKPRFIMKSLSSKNTAIILLMLISTFFLFLWYFTAFIVVLKGIVEFSGEEGNKLLSFIPNFLKGNIKDFLTNPWVLFVLALAQLIKKKGGEEFVELLYKIKYYLLNDKIKCLFRRRFLEKINEIDEDSNKIEIVSHSFGTILTIDYIANIQALKDKNFKFISLGSPISFLSMRSQRIRKNLDEFKVLLASNELIQEWFFIYCKTDWLCPDLPEENMSNTLQPIFNNRFTSLNIGGEESLLERLSGKPHMKYFYDKEVIEEIVLGSLDEEVKSFKKENRD